MLNNAQKKIIRSLHTKKGRARTGMCLVESQTVIDIAGDLIEFTFTDQEDDFYKLVTAEHPQPIAGVAKVPQWDAEDITQSKTIVLLDNVQDPGNVGTILRLALGFNASVVLVESADVTNPKVVRSSVGAVFQVPWMTVPRADAAAFIREQSHSVYRLEKRPQSKTLQSITFNEQSLLIVGSEGCGISLEAKGESVAIEHAETLESLNVSHALAIALYELSTRRGIV